MIGVYAPTDENIQETEWFYEQLQEMIDRYNKNDFLILCGDFNVGKQKKTFSKRKTFINLYIDC